MKCTYIAHHIRIQTPQIEAHYSYEKSKYLPFTVQRVTLPNKAALFCKPGANAPIAILTIRQ